MNSETASKFIQFYLNDKRIDLPDFAAAPILNLSVQDTLGFFTQDWAELYRVLSLSESINENGFCKVSITGESSPNDDQNLNLENFCTSTFEGNTLSINGIDTDGIISDAFTFACWSKYKSGSTVKVFKSDYTITRKQYVLFSSNTSANLNILGGF